MKLSIIVPAFNEEDTIEESLRRVLAVDFGDLETEIIVVDDASTDKTAAIVESLGGRVCLISHPKNRGKGRAIRRALESATGDIVVVHDADLEYDALDLPALVQPIVAGQAPAVFGTRFSQGARPNNMRLQNLVANKLLALAANLLFGAHLTDEATCYKAIRTDLMREMNLQCERFEFCPEVTAKLLRAHHRVVEVPVRYHARTVAEGKKIHWYDGLEAFWTLLKYRLKT